MEIKRRIIPAKPRNKELYFQRGFGGTIVTSTSGTNDNIISQPTYWELVTVDSEGNTLAEPYLKTIYSAISEKEITAYGVGASESDTSVSALYQLSDVDPSVENAPENSILKKIGTHWFAVDGNLQPLLVSGTNIATINGQSLLAGGNIVISTPEALEADKHYTYDQPTSATTWNIQHNLNKFPSVAIVDSAGTIVEGEINYIDSNNISINFKSAFKGKAYIN